MIKGVLLCGGEGTRLRPMTEVVNKHLIRVVDKPMAEYPLLKMIQAGIKDIMIVTGGENFAGVCKYFGSGAKWGVRLNYAIQDKSGGIAQALGLARTFVGSDNMMVCLGDNIWSMDVGRWTTNAFSNCILYSIHTDTPERFGIFVYDDDGVVVDIIEKPSTLISYQACVGIYFYPPSVFDVIERLKPSARGELEITDVNRHYILTHNVHVVEMDGWWSDCGTMETLLQTEELIKRDCRSLSSVRS